MTTIVAPVDGELLDPEWAQQITDAVNELNDDWLTWTPTYSNFSVGNGTATARYRQVGKTVDWRWKVILGSTSTVGTGPSLSLPVSGLHSSFAQFDIMGVVCFNDTGVGVRRGVALLNSGLATVSFFSFNETTGLSATTTATVPHTWAAADVIAAHGSYELA